MNSAMPKGRELWTPNQHNKSDAAGACTQPASWIILDIRSQIFEEVSVGPGPIQAGPFNPWCRTP